MTFGCESLTLPMHHNTILNQESELAQFTRAIGHPARVAILLAMAKEGNTITGRVIEVPSLSPTTVIQHLRDLKRAGLIKGHLFGAKAHYSINMDELHKFFDCFENFKTQLDQKSEKAT
jgi:Fe2+ or Zn2+ uptake regulation protein